MSKLLGQIDQAKDGSDSKVSEIVKGRIDTLIGIPSWQGGIDPETQICLDKLLYHNIKNGNVVTIKKCFGSIISENRNNIIRAALEIEAKYILFLDTDMVFPADAVQLMRAHNKPIVSAMAFAKTYPYVPNMYHRKDRTTWKPVVAFDGLDLLEVDCIGGAFMLVDVDVFRRINPPWFASPTARQYLLWEILEQLFTTERDHKEIIEEATDLYRVIENEEAILGEDYYFSMKLGQADIPIHVDLNLKIGHMGRYMFSYDDFCYAGEGGKEKEEIAGFK